MLLRCSIKNILRTGSPVDYFAYCFAGSRRVHNHPVSDIACQSIRSHYRAEILLLSRFYWQQALFIAIAQRRRSSREPIITPSFFDKGKLASYDDIIASMRNDIISAGVTHISITSFIRRYDSLGT